MVETAWFQMFLETCGYLATFIGVMMEGELSFATSVIAAKSGYYNFWPAMFFGWLGAVVADWFKFLVAKKKGLQLLNKKPKLQAKIDKISVWYDKYPEVILLVYKLFFGVTTVLLILAGLRDVGYVKFAIYSSISITIWSAIIGGSAYFFADSFIANIQWLSGNIFYVLVGLGVIAAGLWFFVKRPYQKECLECK